MTTTPSTRRDIQPLTIEDFGCLVRSGSATRVYVREYTPTDGGGWFVDVDHLDSRRTTKLHTERGSLRVFRTADAAIKAVKEAGIGAGAICFGGFIGKQPNALCT